MVLLKHWEGYKITKATTQSQTLKALTEQKIALASARKAEAEASKSYAEAQKAYAEAQKAQREAEVLTLSLGNQLFLSDSNKKAVWKPMHLQPTFQVNGVSLQPNPIEVATWQFYHGAKHKPVSLNPAQLQQENFSTTLPEKILLPEVLPLHGPNLNEIVLGVGLTGDGQPQAITAPLSKLVHVAVGGSSGWGKSVFLRTLAYQIALAPEAAELALIDLEAATFSPFAHSKRLRYQIADTEIDANAVLLDLIGELKRRKELFRAYPTVESLEAYNHQANNPLPFIALMIDESTALLGDKDIEANIRTLALRARKYGIYAVLGGQDWKATSLDSAIRNQLSTKIQLKAQSKAQSRVLLDSAAAVEINKPGRAYAILPGNTLTEIQTPYISLPMLMKALLDAGSAIRHPQTQSVSIPSAPAPKQTLVSQPTPKQALVLDLFAEGLAVGEIAAQVYGNAGGRQRELVSNTLKKFGLLEV